jgi:hypothetical protein
MRRISYNTAGLMLFEAWDHCKVQALPKSAEYKVPLQSFTCAATQELGPPVFQSRDPNEQVVRLTISLIWITNFKADR